MRQASINNLNAKYINNALAQNLSPAFANPNNLFPMPLDNNNLPLPTAQTQTMPYSISAAQRSSMHNPYQTQDPLAAHNSRIGEIMYDQSAGVTERQRARLKSLNQPKQQSLGLLPLLIPGILAIFLFIFVITCIVKHRYSPFSENSMRYFNQHPEFVSDLSAKDSDFTQAYLQQTVNPTVTYTHRHINSQQQLVNQNLDQQQQLQQSNINNLNQNTYQNLNQNINQNLLNQPNRLISNVQSNISQNFNPNGIIEQNITKQQTTTTTPQLTEESGGECSPGYYYLNGVCHPCKNGYWNGTACITKNLAPGLLATLTNTQTQNPNLNPVNISTVQTNQTIVSSNPLGSNNIASSVNTSTNTVTEVPRCPPDYIWNGTACQKIGQNHHLRKIHH